MVIGASGNIICDDIVVGILLKYLDIVERSAARKKILNEPGARVRAITENLSLNVAPGTRLRFGKECFACQFGVGRKRIVERHARRHCKQPHADQWQQDTGKTYACREHGNDFVRTRHSAQGKKERQQQRNRQQNDENLRDLRGVIANDKGKRYVLVDERRDIVADIKDKPDGDEAGNAVKVNLQEVPNDVSIEKLHLIFEFRFEIAELQ